MLKELYDYAFKNALEVIPGFKSKRLKAYISLAADGTFLGVQLSSEKKTMCPELGSMKNGPEKSNVMAEKADVVLCLDPKRIAKHEFFKNALLSAGEYDEDLKLCVNALENQLEEIKQAFEKSTVSGNDIISFRVNDRPIIGRESCKAWWDEFRAEQDGNYEDTAYLSRCIITGELCKSVRTIFTAEGLDRVGGHSAGDKIICFDKDAFCSYNLKQTHNAAVSEEAITAVNVALENLMEDAPIHAGAKLLHWYKEPIEQEDDLFSIFDTIPVSSTAQNEEPMSTQEVKELIRSGQDGTRPVRLSNRYYLLLLSGANGRIMIRSYMQGSCEELYRAFYQWYDDLSLESWDGLDIPVKLSEIYARLLPYQQKSKDIEGKTKKDQNGEDINTKISAMTSQILYSIINGTPLPDGIAARVLMYIRSGMMGKTEDTSQTAKNRSETIRIPDKTACRILKAWLNRKYGKENIKIMERLNEDNPSKAYHVGRIMAVFAAIQKEALGKVGAGVVERYYSSAISTPALVVGKLSSLSQYHLSKISDEGYVVRYKKMLQEIAGKIGTDIPKTLTLEEQSQFALGYYQQCAKLFEKQEQKEEEE